MLRATDQEFLEQGGLEYEVVPEHGMVCVVIKSWSLPAGYDPQQSDLLIRLPPQFPDTAPDMFWFDPAIRFSRTGAYPQAAESFEQYLGRSWQRFSRHLAPQAWQAGRDSLQSYLALIKKDLEASVPVEHSA